MTHHHQQSRSRARSTNWFPPNGYYGRCRTLHARFTRAKVLIALSSGVSKLHQCISSRTSAVGCPKRATPTTKSQSLSQISTLEGVDIRWRCGSPCPLWVKSGHSVMLNACRALAASSVRPDDKVIFEEIAKTWDARDLEEPDEE